MALGITPTGDGWRKESVGIGSACTKGDLVVLNPARTARPYTSTDSQYYAVALHDSSASLPTGQLLVARPSPGAEAFVDVPTGLGTSDLSRGQTGGIYGSGNRTSFYTTLAGSNFSRLVTVVGDLQTSRVSRVRVSFNANGVFGSLSTATFAS